MNGTNPKHSYTFFINCIMSLSSCNKGHPAFTQNSAHSFEKNVAGHTVLNDANTRVKNTILKTAPVQMIIGFHFYVSDSDEKFVNTFIPSKQLLFYRLLSIIKHGIVLFCLLKIVWLNGVGTKLNLNFP